MIHLAGETIHWTFYWTSGEFHFQLYFRLIFFFGISTSSLNSISIPWMSVPFSFRCVFVFIWATVSLLLFRGLSSAGAVFKLSDLFEQTYNCSVEFRVLNFFLGTMAMGLVFSFSLPCFLSSSFFLFFFVLLTFVFLMRPGHPELGCSMYLAKCLMPTKLEPGGEQRMGQLRED